MLFQEFDMSSYDQFGSVTSLYMMLIFNSINVSSMKKFLLDNITSMMVKFYLTLKIKKWNINFMIMMISFFFTFFLMNFLGLMPFHFSVSSQLSVVMFFSMIIWLTINLWNMKKNFKGFLVHLVPEGTPVFLIFLLFIIELISNLIRPLTLTLRLVGNIVSGHVLLNLLFMGVKTYTYPIVILYMLVELLICILQSYIFVTLVTMYYSEV